MDELRRAAAQRGYEVALEVTEVASGARSDRRGLAEVMKAAHRGEVSAVFVTRLDRFARSLPDLRENVDALSKSGARFVCTAQSIDIGPAARDPMGKLLIGVLGLIAEFEHALITERIKDGVARARAKGVKFGRKRQPVSAAEVVGLRAGGMSWSKVAAQLGCSVNVARLRAREWSNNEGSQP